MCVACGSVCAREAVIDDVYLDESVDNNLVKAVLESAYTYVNNIHTRIRTLGPLMLMNELRWIVGEVI